MAEYIVNISEEISDDGCQEILNMKPLIRCKDCTWFHQAFKSEGRCIKHDNDFHDPDWFCADGKRKEGR